ncbi:MAG: serine/threonine-protein phosphatase [Muribaculaceae bacterium]|nr:serine/threonine-protein phosphatase [Muribaculaceae bacterium]
MKITTATGYSFHQLGHRENQEDSRFPDVDECRMGQMFFMVCDGVGGSEKGEQASGIVASHFGKKLSKMDLNEEFTDEKMLEVLDDAYIALDDAADDSNRDMGTTLTMLCFHKGGCVMAHIGDSRIYQIRPLKGIIYRSDDHSLVNQLVRAGQITPEEAINHPQSNIITRCMGPTNPDQRRSMATVCYSSNVKEGDYFVLCSDGVLGCITDDELVDLLDSPLTDEEKVAQLADICAESSDNNTAWVVRIEDVELTPEEQEYAQNDVEFSPGSTHPCSNVIMSIRDLESVTRGKSTFMSRFRKLFS